MGVRDSEKLALHFQLLGCVEHPILRHDAPLPYAKRGKDSEVRFVKIFRALGIRKES